MAQFSSWYPLTAASIRTLPDEPAVYELGTLVRSVLLIGAADRGLLRAALAGHLRPQGLQHPPGAIYFRYMITPEPAEQATARLDHYRRTHCGRAPAWQHLALGSRTKAGEGVPGSKPMGLPEGSAEIAT